MISDHFTNSPSKISWHYIYEIKLIKIVLLIIIIVGQFFLACSGNLPNPAVREASSATSIIGPDYRSRENAAYDRLEEMLVSSSGCKVTYTYFKPRERSNDVLVVLGHGFMRSKKRMAHLAGHLASWGLPVVNLEFCNSKFWAGNHDLNGADMVAVAQKVHAGKVIYVGFSAGGLAAILATHLDHNTLAFFGLDMVDNKGLGREKAPNVMVPMYGLIAAPSACNAKNNGLYIYALASQSKVIEVMDSSHCHFEFPVDGKCSLVCGRGEKRLSREIIQQTILGLTTAFLLWQSGIDPNGETWWSEMQLNYVSLREAGYVNEPIIDETVLDR